MPQAACIGQYRKRSGLALAALCMLLVASGTARAQTALPDPAEITLPDLASFGSAANSHQPPTYFYLTNPSVSFGEAYADFADCYRFRAIGPQLDLQSFVPWVEGAAGPGPRKDQTNAASPYGVVGAVIGAWLVPALLAAQMRGEANMRLRTCMVPRGYKAHPLAKSVWMQLQSANDAETVARLAKIATLPSLLSSGKGQ